MEENFNYWLIVKLVEERKRTGIERGYSTKELMKWFPWRKSRYYNYKRKAEEQKIIIKQKKRYRLNEENERVKRILDYYFVPKEKRKGMVEENIELQRKMKRILRLQEREEELEEPLMETKVKEKQKKFIKEIQETLKDDCHQLESLIFICKKTIREVIDYK